MPANKKIHTYIVRIWNAALVAGSFLASSSVFAATSTKKFVPTAQDAPFYPTVQPSTLPTEADFGKLLTYIINYFLGLVGLIAVLMLVIGGIRYVTSGGNEQTIEKAKHTILYAIIGIVVVAISFAIVFTMTSTFRTF